MIYGTLLENTIREDITGGMYILEAEDEDVKKLFNNWKTSNEIHKRQIFKNSSVSEEDYDKLIEAYKVLRTADNYADYKKAFEIICKYCHIAPNGTIITKCKIKSGKVENNNSIEVEYSYNTKKIKLPDGMNLYHMSKVEGIKELIPQFRGKSAKGFLYYKPRVYFTIHKNMNKLLADYKLHEKMHKYVSKVPIRDVYVDPLVWVKSQGAVYVETSKPIPVEELK